MAESKKDKLKKLLNDYMAETVHTSFRKGANGAEAMKVWRDIKDLPNEQWSDAVDWMCWALTEVIHDKVEVK